MNSMNFLEIHWADGRTSKCLSKPTESFPAQVQR